MLVDARRWRQERISDKALRYLAANPASPFSDQDALNIACDGLWKPLDARWNFQNHYSTPVAGMGEAARPAVVHFVTASKPWVPAIRSPNSRFYDEFRSRTLYARTRTDRLRDAMVRFLAGVRNVVARRIMRQPRESPPLKKDSAGRMTTPNWVGR